MSHPIQLRRRARQRAKRRRRARVMGLMEFMRPMLFAHGGQPFVDAKGRIYAASAEQAEWLLRP